MLSKTTIVCIVFLTFSIFVSTQGDEVIQDVQIIQPVQTIEIKASAVHQKIQEIDQIIEKQSTNEKINARIKLDLYTLGKLVFNAQKYFGDFCETCKKLQYISFKIGNRYLTAYSTTLKFDTSSSPTNSQLFIAQQQIDGSWAFKSLTQGKYIRASNDGSTINYQTYVGPWQRWYIQRHGSHLHIQSAQFQHYYWIYSAGSLKQLENGASALLVEHWPKLKWLWNW